MAREVRYMILYPLRQMSVYSFATPRCVQSRPIIVNTWPSASDLQDASEKDIMQINHVILRDGTVDIGHDDVV